MKKVFIIHFQPLELFPPAMNMIDFISREKNVQIVISTNKKSDKNSLKTYTNESVKIFRPATLSRSGIRQYINYAAYYFGTFLNLLWHRPETVLYIETLSSWPALLYKKLRGKHVRLMVHYHEYTEPRLYQEGMLLSRRMHKEERKMYPKYSWISHTNPVRMEMFKNDCNLTNLDSSIFHILPNYPSKSWASGRDVSSSLSRFFGSLNDSRKSWSTGRDTSRDLNDHRKKLVFVGSLGYQNMYLQEVLDWLGDHPEEFSLDIYSYNIDSKARDAIEKCGLANVHFFGGCDYQALPEILKNYDIGLVIYKPFSKNTIHAVSNKVFEYLACGLDVWFSEDMTYTFEYVTEDTYPKVLPVNFQELETFDDQSAISRTEQSYKPSHYFYENIYPELLGHIHNTKENNQD